MSVLPVIFLIFVTAYATSLRRGHQYASAMRPDSSEQCIELNSTTANTLSGDNHLNAPPPQRRFRFHPNAHFAIEWILNPLSRDRFQMRRNHKFTAAPKDEVENPVIATERLDNTTGNDSHGDGAVADEGGGGGRGPAAEEDEDADRVDFAVDENRSSIVTSLQSPSIRRWPVPGGRTYTRGIKRSSSVAVLQEISNQDIPESLAI